MKHFIFLQVANTTNLTKIFPIKKATKNICSIIKIFDDGERQRRQGIWKKLKNYVGSRNGYRERKNLTQWETCICAINLVCRLYKIKYYVLLFSVLYDLYCSFHAYGNAFE